MSDIAVVLITGEDGSGPVADAVLELETFVHAGLVRPFWSVLHTTSDDPSEGVPARLHRREKTSDTELYASLAAQRLSTLRLAALGGPTDPAGAARAAATLGQTLETLEALRAVHTRIVSARLWLPYWDKTASPPDGFFSVSAESNLVILPEDRRSNLHTARQVSEDDLNLFSLHAAVEIATQLGLWLGMETAPVDGGEPRPIGYGEPRIHVARSFARTAVGPPLPFDMLTNHHGTAAIPTGCREAPNPPLAAAELAERASDLLEGLRFSELPPPPAERVRLGIGAALVEWLRELGSFVRQLPSRLLGGMTRDFEEFAGQLVQTLIGESSVVEVVWKGKRSEQPYDEPDLTSVAEELRATTERRLQLQGGPQIDQSLWKALAQVVLGAVDGSAFPEGIDPPTVGGHRAVITAVDHIAPEPQNDPSQLAGHITEPKDHPSLLSHLHEKFVAIGEFNRQAVIHLFEGIRQRIDLLDRYRAPSLAVVTAVAVTAFTAMIVSIAVFSGLFDAIGFLDISPFWRDFIWVASTTLFLAVLAAAFYYAQGAVARRIKRTDNGSGDESEESDANGDRAKGVSVSLPLWGAGIGGALALMFQAALAPFGYPLEGKTLFAAAVTLGGIVGGCGLLVELGRLSSFSRTALTMLHVAATSALVYASVMVVGLIVRPDGWYADLDSTERLQLLWRTASASLLLVVLSILFIGWRRTQEKTRLTVLGNQIRGLLTQINEALVSERRAELAQQQYLGTAVGLAAMVWRPFGLAPQDTEVNVDLPESDLGKAAASVFDLTGRGAQALHGSLRRTVSEPGWIMRQYETAVGAYRRDVAARLGSDDSEAVGRPDQEPYIVSGLEVEELWERSERYRFAKRLLAGELSPWLSEALYDLDLTAVYSQVLGDGQNLSVRGTDDQDLKAFFDELVAGTPPDMPIRYLTPAALAEWPDRAFGVKVWWPAAGSEYPLEGDPAGAVRIINAGPAGVVLIGLRSDWSPPFEPFQLFPDVEQKVGPAPEEPGEAPPL